MTDDAELLRRYAADRSEADVAELVRRHVDLVYSAALRQVGGDHHQAQEVTQMVFIDLTRKAAALARHPVLQAWLHRSTCLAARSIRRGQGRRMKYERAAAAEAVIAGVAGDSIAWEDVRPVLDDAINELSEGDRQAILLRFFANRPFGEVGRQLSLTENAARMRVERALGKLREVLARRGITSSSAALAVGLAGQAVAAAPAGVASATTGAATALAWAAGGWAAFMTTAKVPLSLTAAVLLAGAGVVALQDRENRRAALDLAELSRQNGQLAGVGAENQRLAAEAQKVKSLEDADASLRLLRAEVRELEAKAATQAQKPLIARAGPAQAVKPDSNPALDITQLDQRPVAVMQTRPEYPPELRQAGISGEVLVDFTVGGDGRVYNAHALNATSTGFEDSAVQAVSQWIFKPGQLAGQTVNTHMQVPIVYSPAIEPAPTAATWF
ncbi:MAG TPA: TonB family protein [Opitutaceae bacterium]|nr:TonB family protein [Opitutaceae bacterium]